MVNSRQKFSKIYDRYIDSIYRFILIKVSSSQVAEDLTSETFLRSWEKYRQKKEQSIKNPKAYIYRVARNLVVDFYRERGQTTIMSIEQEEIELESEEDDIEKKQQQIDTLQDVRKALVKLKPDYQDVVILRYVDGLPLRDIAKIMNKSYGATRVILHRAMEQLKQEV